MKYDGVSAFASSLPDAPLPMPKQQLMPARSLRSSLLALLHLLPRF